MTKKKMWAKFGRDHKVIRIGHSAGIRLPKGFARAGQEVRFIRKGARRIELVVG